MIENLPIQGLSRTDWGGWVSLSATISHLQLTKRQGEGHRNPLNFVWAGLSSIPVVNDPMDALNAAFLAVEISRHWRTLGEHAGSNDDTIKSPWQLIPSLWDLFPLIVLPDPAWMHVLFLLVLYLVMGRSFSRFSTSGSAFESEAPSDAGTGLSH